MRERSIQAERIERVVVRGANWVGDAVMTVPALRELRRVLPSARITLATRPWAEGIFRGVNFIDDLMPTGDDGKGVRGFWRRAKDLRGRGFDLAVLFPNAFSHALLARAARVPLRIGYATDGRHWLLTHPLAVPRWRGRRHEVHYYLNIVAELERLLRGSSEIETREPDISLCPPAAEADEARAILREHGVRLDRPVVALCPGSTNSRAKRWPAERFAALADMLVEGEGAQILLIGAGEESEVSDEVRARMRHEPFVLTGRTDLSQTAGVLSLADLLVTNDTGPAHLAAAVGCRVVVIFGPTNPVTTAPFSASAEIVRSPPECAPCMLRDCPIDHRCMTAITPGEVHERAARALTSRTRLQEAAR